MTHIIVCVKIVMDPEMPYSVFKVDTNSKKPVAPEGTASVLSSFDESALEAALRIVRSRLGDLEARFADVKRVGSPGPGRDD